MYIYRTIGIPGEDLIYPNIYYAEPNCISSDGAYIMASGVGLSGAYALYFTSISGVITSGVVTYGNDDAIVSGTVPALDAGRYDITIESSGGTATLIRGLTTSDQERKITSIERAIGDTDTRLTVTITSDEGLFIGVSGSDAVTFGGIPAVSYEVISPYAITAVVPNLNPDFYRVEVN